MRTGPLAVAGWVVAATLTLGVSWSAMGAVRTAVAPEDLASGLPTPDETPAGPTGTGPTSSGPTSTAPSPTATTPTAPTATAPTATALTRAGTGGTIRVRCTAGGVPELVSVIPRQGFAAEVDDSPGEVKFTSDGHRTEMTASCAGGRPRVTVEEDDRGGGGDDNSGPGGGGNSGPGGGDDD